MFLKYNNHVFMLIQFLDFLVPGSTTYEEYCITFLNFRYEN